MERATGSADRPDQFSSLPEWELISDPSSDAVDDDDIPEAAHPQEFDLYEEYCFAPLSAENLGLHNLIHGSLSWHLDLYENSHSSDEVVVQGQPVQRRNPYGAYCHCGKCNWIWFLQGWECWPVPTIEDID